MTSYPSRLWSLLSSQLLLMSAPAGGLSHTVHAPSGGAAQEHDGRLLTLKRFVSFLFGLDCTQMKLHLQWMEESWTAYWRSIIMCCRENNAKHIEKLIPQSSSTQSAEEDCGTPWKAPEQLLMDIAERFVMLNFHWCEKDSDHLSSKSTYAQYKKNSIKCSLKVP